MSTEKNLDSSAAQSLVELHPPEAKTRAESARSAAADAEIAALLARGDHRAALSLCARTHGRAIGRLCMALLGSQSEADDALQETLLAAHGSFAAFRGEGSFRAWLFAIARRRCARVLERRGDAHDRDARDDAGRDTGELADALLERRRAAEAARALLARIRPTEREALLLRYEAELSFREVGEACGVDEAAARKRVSRALAKLRDLSRE